ncbi:UDP-N-acetylglucosamine pyrophosphorylase [Cladochytrium tenue]|nr:UDP-N-acetylglucosamine pyrophosphorylase [Cladochytrium tenue]
MAANSAATDAADALLRARYEAAGQAHVFTFWDVLDTAEREQLRTQLAAVDVERCNAIYRAATGAHAAASAEQQQHDKLAPLPDEAFESTLTADAGVVAAWRREGLRLIAAGKVAVLLLAGGQGTRLGSSAPKGCYDIGLPSGKSLFQMQAERIGKVVRLAASAAGVDASSKVRLPWYVMTSGPTRAATEAFFEAHGFWGLPREDVVFFDQGVLPAFDAAGKFVMETRASLALAPDGNGGIYAALVRERVLDDMERRGIPYVHAYCVDNCLVRVADPVFIGYSASKGAECGAKSVPKAHAHESVGVLCLRGGKFGVVEYSEIPRELAEARRPAPRESELLFSAANIVNHFYTVEFLRRVGAAATGGGDAAGALTFHVANKKVPHVDLTSGAAVKPSKPNAVKLEQFIFDAFPLAAMGRMAVLEVARRDEFSPLKNAPGQGADDSPETSRRDLLAQGRRFVEAAGAVLPHAAGVGVEVAPALSYAGEGLEALRGAVLADGVPEGIRLAEAALL